MVLYTIPYSIGGREDGMDRGRMSMGRVCVCVREKERNQTDRATQSS